MKIGLRTVKTAVGATLAILIAEWLGLEYAVSAGLITVLSIQNTKKGSIQLAVQRVYSTVIALTISAIFFLLLGFNAIAFGLYLLVFIPIAVRLKVTDGIVVSSVLVTHILVEQSLSLFWFTNEMLLMAVGAGIGILLNLYMPKMDIEMKQQRQKIESIMRQIFFCFAQDLKREPVYLDEKKLIKQLSAYLTEANEQSRRHFDNQLFADSRYYIKYIDMRTVQLRVIKQMSLSIQSVSILTNHATKMAELVEKTALSISEQNPAEDLIEDVNQILTDFRQSELPKTREEFEGRALLFQFLNDLRYLLELKRDFTQQFKEDKELLKINAN
ncbi:aromatic acid exporter family protein [Listeria booriae]|uniref:Aromatic acid exporter family protein n=1 Tax=Listeria booriae TaxID=1552123 RepID=A0A841Y5M9_9LIST|nr:aromatic acid exporter family protein [Listeria booriae]MBC1371224.1 aromatic acid exporter family protein [Listeria booriae]